MEGRVRVKVKAIGALSVQDAPIASPDNGQSHSSSENRNRNHLDVSQVKNFTLERDAFLRILLTSM